MDLSGMTEKYSKGRSAGLARIICLALIIVMALISVFVYGAPAPDMLLMILFTVFYLQLPGMLLVRLCGYDRLRASTELALGLFAGWSFELLNYFFADLIGSNITLYIAGPILSAVYLASLAGMGREGFLIRRLNPRRLSIAFCLFIILTLLYCLLNTQYVYLAPELRELTYMNADKAFHMGLINSLSHDYPLQSPWVHGIFFNYHIFSEMMLSIPVRLFDIQSAVITQSFGPFFTTYCFCLSTYAFFREMSSKPERAGIYCLLILLSNFFIARKINKSIAFLFLLTNDNSSGYGIAAMLMAIIAFDKWYDAYSAGEKGSYKKLILCTVLIMLVTGIKGPMGAILVAGIWGTLLLGMILGKVKLRSAAPAMLITAGFLLIYKVVLGSKGQVNAAGDSVIALAKIADISFWKRPLVAMLKAAGIPTSIRLVIVLVVFMMFLLTVFFVPFCLGYIRELVLVLMKRKDYEVPKVLIYAVSAVGFIGMMLLNYSGHSQIYFGLVLTVLAPAVAFRFIEDLETASRTSAKARNVLRATLCIMSVTLVFTTIGLAEYYGKHINNAIRNADPALSRDKYMSISEEEYEAMQWIELNTDKDAMLATDRYYSVSPDEYSYENRWSNRFFLYEVYSNRFSYISGSGYILRSTDWPKRRQMIETNKKLYDADNEERGDLARELDVDYVVVSKRFTDADDLENNDYDLCFTNEDVDIYRIAE